MRERVRCNAVVWRRDTYRVKRGAKSGFAMHYDRGQCLRAAQPGCDLCAQHRAMGGVLLWERRGPAEGQGGADASGATDGR